MPKREEKITREIFDHLVDLAALELKDEETEYIRKELNNQLAAIDELAAIEIPEGTNAASYGVPYTPLNSQPLRRDAWEQCEDADAILGQAPEHHERYIIVPDIPHTTLE
jgi:aspartyl-tRNA(Asn)/glutamyl-tRNA(Gln) amidotransferase subunit C